MALACCGMVEIQSALEEAALLRSSIRVAVLLGVTGVSFGQAPMAASGAKAPMPPKGFSGTIVSVAGDEVTLLGKDGNPFVVHMTAGWTVSVNKPVDASAIKVDDFVATTNVVVSEHVGKAMELRILEPGYRPEEGTHAVAPGNPNMMTHGTVKSALKTAHGMELEVSYPGGSRNIVVPPGVPVTLSDPLDKSVLKPGVAVASVTRPGADGVERASRLQLAGK